jgi:hypothetical protein
MMAALVRSRGHSITKDPKSTPDCCILHGKRADNGDTWTISFSLKDAELAGLLSSPTWKKYPQVMLYNRAMSQLFRQLFPDLSLGAGYVEDELKEITKTGEYAAVKPLDIQMVEAEVVKEERKLVSQEQADELKELLKKCPHEYVEKVTSGLLRMKPAIEKLEDLPLDLFEKAKAAAIKNAKAKSLEAEENKEVVNG